MLARTFRLRAGRDITRVYKKGAYGSGGPLFVRAMPSGLPHSRVAIVVSKKVSKRAVVRNRIRRRISAQLESVWQTIPPGYDIVITSVADVSDLIPTELSTRITTALRKTGMKHV